MRDERQRAVLCAGQRVTSEWANRETFANSRQQIRDFADIREYVVFRNMYNLFEWEKNTYTVSVTGAGGAVTTLNTQKRNGRGILSAEYNCKCTVPLKAEIADGWEFVSWEINGVTYDTPEVELNARTAGTDGRIICEAEHEAKRDHGRAIADKGDKHREEGGLHSAVQS